MNLIPRIDALLPQTQCGKCGHPGCQPYAQAIAAGEPINRCPPGGQETVVALARLLKRPVLALDVARGPAPAQVAFIREAECIGCTKCIQACPVDAIVGAAKLMHSVLIDECTGCDLCVAPCPVDCIDMLPLPAGTTALVAGLASDAAQLHARQDRRDRARRRFEQRAARLQRGQEQRVRERQARASVPASRPPSGVTSSTAPTGEAANTSPVQAAIERVRAQKAAAADAALKQAKIAVAMSRAQLNKSLKAFGSPPTADQHARLMQLSSEHQRAEAHLQRLLGSTP